MPAEQPKPEFDPVVACLSFADGGASRNEILALAADDGLKLSAIVETSSAAEVVALVAAARERRAKRLAPPPKSAEQKPASDGEAQ